MFDSYHDAVEAVRRIEGAGIPPADISIVSNDPANRDRLSDASATTATGRRSDATDSDDAAAGAGTGASLGAMLGGGAGLLAGLGMLAIPGLGPVVAAGWLASTLVGVGAGAATGGLVGALAGAGIDEADAHTYAEGIRRGGTLVTVRAEEAQADRVIDILDDEGTVNLEDREAAWRKEGWQGRYAPDQHLGTTGVTGTAGPVGAPTTAAKPDFAGPATTARKGAIGSDREERIPIAEERLNVGKREVDQGRVRVRSYVVETPVQEQVNLRQEHVSVERRPVDRAVTGKENLFQERTIEATEKAEQAVVSKQARVKEELVVKKGVDQRTETVSDTVRRTEVKIDDERGIAGSKARRSS
jgi:uncharacterized protein (TIGR02271 family)